MNKVSDSINRFVEYITSGLLFVMVIIIFMQVFFRHILDNSLSWSEELSRYLFIWITLLGVSVGVKRGFLVSIPILVDRLKGLSKKTIEIGCSLLIIVFAISMVFYGYEISLRVVNQLSPAMRISMSYIYFSVPVSGALILLHMLPIVVDQFKVKRTNHTNHTNHSV